MKVNYNIPDYAVKKCFEKFKRYIRPFGYGKLVPGSKGFEELDIEIASHLSRVSKNFLRYQDLDGKNVGMLLALHELKESATVCLSDPVASTQIDNNGKTLKTYFDLCLNCCEEVKEGAKVRKR